jgi:hypothetical protein
MESAEKQYKTGNWVNWKPNSGVSSSLPIESGHNAIKINTIKGTSLNNHPIEEITPIPLTTDLLIKCGFEQTGSPYLYRHSLFPTFIIELSDRYSWHFNYKPLGAENIQLTGLHHLQNLFEKVTGYELNVGLAE